MEMLEKRQQSSQDEADGNPQRFREFHSITHRHRSGGGIASAAVHVAII